MVKNVLMAVLICLFVSACSNEASTYPHYEVLYVAEDEEMSDANSELRSNVPMTSDVYKIAVVSKISGIPYFNAAEEGAYEAARDLNVHVIYTGPQIADAPHQIEVIEDLIEQRVDLIAVAANDPVKLLPVLERARSEGIRIITWDSDTNPEGRTFFVNQVDAETFGRHLMDTLAMNIDGEAGPYALITGSLSAANLNEWIYWIEEQRKQFYPEMDQVEIVPNDEDLQLGFERSMELLERHPNLKGIIGINSIGPIVAAQAVKAHERSENIAVVGTAPPSLVRDYLKEGVIDIATMWSPTKLGYLTVVLGKQLLDGSMPYDGQEVENVGTIRFRDDIVIMGEPLDFTKENVDQYDF